MLHTVLIYELLLQHVSVSLLGHLQGAHGLSCMYARAHTLMRTRVSSLKMAKKWGQNMLEQQLINKNIVQPVGFSILNSYK
jgi:hypothetical protein